MKITEPTVSRRNARGKLTRNPGYEPNNHWNLCDVCGCAIRAKETRKTWDGLVVCPDDWDYRHPQDFVRGRKDDTSPVGLIRPDDGAGRDIPLGIGALPAFAPEDCDDIAVAGFAVAGCAIAGKDYEPGDLPTGDIPQGTFGV